MKPRPARMQVQKNYIARPQPILDTVTVHEIFDSDEEDVVHSKHSHNVSFQSAGILDHVEQQAKRSDCVNQRSFNSETSKNPHMTTTMTVPSASRKVVNYLIIRRRRQQIFTDEQEKELSRFVRDASDFYNGMTSKDVRTLAYVYSVCNAVKIPISWRVNYRASIAWCSGFTKRNQLTLVSQQ